MHRVILCGHKVLQEVEINDTKTILYYKNSYSNHSSGHSIDISLKNAIDGFTNRGFTDVRITTAAVSAFYLRCSKYSLGTQLFLAYRPKSMSKIQTSMNKRYCTGSVKLLRMSRVFTDWNCNVTGEMFSKEIPNLIYIHMTFVYGSMGLSKGQDTK